MKANFKKQKVVNFPKVVLEGNSLKRNDTCSAGWDICSNQISTILNPGERCLFSTNIFLKECDENLYLRIAPRSSLALKQGIDVLAGVIDSNYKGEIKVLLINLGEVPVRFDKGDRIAQIIPTYYANNCIIENANILNHEERGTKGFGSSGI